MKKLVFILFLGFIYADCEEVTDQAACEASEHCLWDAVENLCEDEHHDHDSHGDCGDFDHLNVDGLILEHDGNEIYRQFQGLIEGDVDVPLNSTLDISVHFLNSNGDEIEYGDDNPASCYPLDFSISNSSIASISIDGHDDHDDHDHGAEEHCEDFLTEADCGVHSECEWHTDDSACEDAGSDDHDDHDHGDEEHCEDFLTEADCGVHSECEWHADDSACEDAGSDDHDDHGDGNHNIFEITGLNIGSTTFSLSIMHDGHADYTSMPILLNVIESDDHDDHDHGDEEHCEDFLTEADCGAHSECEWHADEMACEDAEGDDHDDHDHADCGEFDHLNVDGLILEHDGNEIYRQFQGLVEGEIELPLNSTWDVSVHFLDANGDEIEYGEDNPASCYPLSVEITDTNIASTSSEHHDDHDEHDHGDEEHCEDFLTEADCGAHSECEWHADEMACEDAEGDDHDDHDDHGDEEHNVFEITGMNFGFTIFTVSIMHDGHADYTSMPIGLTVVGEVCDVTGDVNLDGGTNVLDVIGLVDCVLNNNCSEYDHVCSLDMNSDGGFNVLDVVALVDCIMANNCYGRIDDALVSNLLIDGNLVSITSDGYIGGVQMTISHSSDFAIKMTEVAYLADYVTKANQTTLMVIKPVEELFSYNGEFEIIDLMVVNSQNEIAINVIANSFTLSDAYPNPFNPSTSVNLTVPFSTNVDLSVYNINGQVVSNLANGFMQADTYHLTWDAKNMTSGVYFIKATLNGITQTQKVMLIK